MEEEPQLLGRCYLSMIFSDLMRVRATSAAPVHPRIPEWPAWCCWLSVGRLIVILVASVSVI